MITLFLEPVDYSNPHTQWYDTDALLVLGREFGIVKYILRIFCFVHSTWWETWWAGEWHIFES